MMEGIKNCLHKFNNNIKQITRGIHCRLISNKLALGKKTAEQKINKSKPIEPESLALSTAELSSSSQNYFIQAKSWADDFYTMAVVSRNRYKLAFMVSMGLLVLLAIAIDSLIPLQHMEPLLINHYEDGRISVQPVEQPYAPTNQAQVESELVRYVVNRESYDASSYHTQYSLTNLLSNNTVANQYMKSQSTDSKRSPINILGSQGYRTVHVNSVVFLDASKDNKNKPKNQQTHHNLAQINFTITDHFKNSSLEKTIPLTALISWTYLGTPSNPANMWRDWDGFTVTRYTVEQRNV